MEDFESDVWSNRIERNLAIDPVPNQIAINSIVPGAIETPTNDKLSNDPVKRKERLETIRLGRLGKKKNVAGIASFLATADSDSLKGTKFFFAGGLLWNYREQ